VRSQPELRESSKACYPVAFYVSTVGRDFNINPGHYIQQTRYETENVYWQCNRIGAKPGTTTTICKLSMALSHSPPLPTEHTSRASDTEDSIEDTFYVSYETDFSTASEFYQACNTYRQSRQCSLP